MANQPKKYKKFVATAATATLVASAIVPVASAASLSDIKGNTHEEAITSLVDAGVINGYPDGTFQPNKTLTRSDVVKLLGKYLVSKGHNVPEDYKTNVRFNDLSSASNDELLKYAAVVYDAGVFVGSNGNLMAGDNITRENMAVVIVRAFDTLNNIDLASYVKEQEYKKDVKDLYTAKSEARSAIEVLDFFDITNPAVANFNPKGSTTRGQFATFLYKTINSDFSAVTGVANSSVSEIKAINNTTVEVSFKEAVDNIEALDFTIEGLDVKNAVVKQTDAKTVVLTTAAQTGDKVYTLNVNAAKAGTFKGISAVIPTAVNVTTGSVQGIIGKEVTVKAEVTVPEGQSKAGIPVTFNITSNSANTDKIEVQSVTNADGVATYTYTRYYASEDTFTAYATDKSSVFSTGKVYWANDIQLAVSELTSGNDLANETKKSYKVTGDANSTYYIAIKENLNVAPDKVVDVKVQNHGSTNFVTPYELTTGGTQFATVTTNSKGEGTFTVYGSNLEATPIVYDPTSTPTTSNSKTYSKLDLQAVAPTVKFSKVDRLAVTVKAEGSADSAEYATVPTTYNRVSTGGRTYTATVTDKDGKVAPEGTTAYVTFKSGNVAGDVYFSTGTNDFAKVAAGSVFPVRVGKDGQATFRVAGKGATTYAKPTVFLNTAGDTTPVKLDTADVQQDGEVTYFKSAVVVNATLSVKDQYGRTVTSLNAGQEAYFTYQSVDQNGFAYRPTEVTSGSTTQTIWVPVYGKDASGNDILLGYEQKTVTIPGSTVQQYNLTFDVTSLFGNATVRDAGGSLINPSQNLGNTKTYQVKSDAEGKAVVRVTSEAADTVSVNVTGASNFLPTQTASVSFTNSTIVPALYSGDVASYNSIQGTLTFAGKQAVSLYGDNIRYSKGNEVIANYDAFIDLLAKATGTVSVTRTVGTDGITTFNIYNTATTGTKPVDTATPAVNKDALQTAVNAETTANLQEANYTAATWAPYATALTNARAVLANTSSTQTQVNDALTALTTAKAGLVVAPSTLEGVVITAAEGLAPSQTAGLLGLFTGYEVSGTVANDAITSVTLTYTFDNASETPVTKTVTVVDGKFSDTLGAQSYSVKSVKVTSSQATGSVSKDITTKVTTN